MPYTGDAYRQLLMQIGVLGGLRWRDKRVNELADICKQALAIIDHANDGAWSNGNTANGVDEGDVLTMNMIDGLKERLSKL